MFNLFPLNLMLFSDESGDMTGSDVADNNTNEGMQASNDGNRHRTKSDAKVVYGKQEGMQNVSETADESDEKQKLSFEEQFEAMIKGDFKEAYDKKVQSHIKHRLGDVKKLENENSDMRAVLNVLADRYGTSSPKELLQMIEGDNKIWEEAAYESGMTVEQFRDMKQTERLKNEYQQRLEMMEREERAKEIYNSWLSDAEIVKESYPDFDLPTELQNPDFRGLIQNNIPMKKAYETIHFDELMQGVSEFSAKRAEENAMLKIQKRQSRPRESIASGKSGVIIKDDPSKLTSKDRAEIIKRAMNGEKISF